MAAIASTSISKGVITLTLDPRAAKEINDKLKLLSRAVRMKLLRRAVKAGAKIMKAQAIKEAPIDSARLYQSIVVRMASAVESGLYGEMARVIVARKKHKVFYAHFVEYGHITVSRGGKTGRPVPANPFMLRAFDKTKREVLREMLHRLRKGIVTEINKIRGKKAGGKNLSGSFAKAFRK